MYVCSKHKFTGLHNTYNNTGNSIFTALVFITIIGVIAANALYIVHWNSSNSRNVTNDEFKFNQDIINANYKSKLNKDITNSDIEDAYRKLKITWNNI